MASVTVSPRDFILAIPGNWPAEQRRLEIRQIERADRRWEIASQKRRDEVCAELERNWHGDRDGLFLAELAALGGLREPPPPGFGSRRRTCIRCGSKAAYNDVYDANYCPACNRWLESACDSPTCGHCANRPRRPLRGAVQQKKNA